MIDKLNIRYKNYKYIIFTKLIQSRIALMDAEMETRPMSTAAVAARAKV